MKKLTAFAIVIALALVGIAVSSASAHSAGPRLERDGGSGGGW